MTFARLPQGVQMTLSPIRYVQQWSTVFPGESGQHLRLATHSCKALRREAQLEHNLQRCGIALRGDEEALPVSIPVAPAQPRLRVLVAGLAPVRIKCAAPGAPL